MQTLAPVSPPSLPSALPPDSPHSASVVHESAVAQVCGLAPYIDDLPQQVGTLYAAPIVSPVAHGRLLGVDAAEAVRGDGVVGLLTHEDIVGDKRLATFVHDEPIFAVDEVCFAGQVVGLVVARDMRAARAAARRVRVQVQELPAVLDVRAAHVAQSYVLPPVRLARGEASQAIARAQHQLSGQLCVGGQEHFYLEGQVAYALPQAQEGWLVYSSTQHPGEVQHWVAHALGLPLSHVRVECRRMGGGFGGKETQAGHVAVWAALAARRFGAPVKLRLDRDDDFTITGKRHPFEYDYRVGFDAQGVVAGLEVDFFVDCGFSADLSGPVADRALFHVDNAYYLEHVTLNSYRCRTHMQSHTAFRGFGGPQGVVLIEMVMGEIARHLGMDPLAVRQRNFYQHDVRNITPYGMQVSDNILQPLVSDLAQRCAYEARRAQIAQDNRRSSAIKRGLALTPVKFGISFTATQFNQAGALVHLYTDGSVLVNHGGTEMGQGLHTKVCQIVARELGLSPAQVRISASDTSKVPNASATAASSGTDLNGRAAQYAARAIRDRLAQWLAQREGCEVQQVVFEQDAGGCAQVRTPGQVHTLVSLVQAAYHARVQLWSEGFYRTPRIYYDPRTLQGRPFYYFAYGAACSEVAIDTRTGESRVLRVDILHDVGHSINPAIDIGQIEGGFVQGMGWLTTEELVWKKSGARAGELLTHAPSTYKIPTAADVPGQLHVALWGEANREDNVGGSKAVGEPPFMLACSVWEALRDAVAQANAYAAQAPAGSAAAQEERVQLHAPATPERILRALHRL